MAGPEPSGKSEILCITNLGLVYCAVKLLRVNVKLVLFELQKFRHHKIARISLTSMKNFVSTSCVCQFTVKSRFNESRFNEKSRFKAQNVVTKIEFFIKKSRFRVKSRFKESKYADGGHSLNRDFTVHCISLHNLLPSLIQRVF